MRVSTTDSDARVMKMADGGFRPRYNVQFGTDTGTQFDAWDASTTIDWMPDDFQTWRLEFVHREASVPNFAGTGGVTGPTGYTTAPVPTNWSPDLSKQDTRIIGALLLRF